jgi:hypothetical protein
VSENEKKLEILRKENEKKREELHYLKIDNDSSQMTSHNTTANSQPEFSEIVELNDDIAFLGKELEKINDRKKKMHLVGD